MGIRGPRTRTLGTAFAGIVEQATPGTPFTPGDRVAGMNGARLGAHAQYAAVPAASLTRMPSGVSHADAAGTLFGGTTALYFLRDRAHLAAGAAVLVNGASGAVGSSAVQLARHLGAAGIVGVSRSVNHELLGRLGATRLVDYEQTPVASLNTTYDVVFDTVGNLSKATGTPLLAPSGSLILAVATLGEVLTALGQVIAGVATEKPADMAFLLELVASGDLDPVTSVLGGLDSLRDAHALVDSGHKVGNLVVLPWE